MRLPYPISRLSTARCVLVFVNTNNLRLRASRHVDENPWRSLEPKLARSLASGIPSHAETLLDAQSHARRPPPRRVRIVAQRPISRISGGVAREIRRRATISVRSAPRDQAKRRVPAPETLLNAQSHAFPTRFCVRLGVEQGSFACGSR